VLRQALAAALQRSTQPHKLYLLLLLVLTVIAGHAPCAALLGSHGRRDGGRQRVGLCGRHWRGACASGRE
jgi:hypothetical protein